MRSRFLTALALALIPASLPAAEAVFHPTTPRVFFVGAGEGQVAYLDLDNREGGGPSFFDIAHAGGPKIILGLTVSKKGNILFAAPDAVWAYDPEIVKAVRVAALPEKFSASDLAYQETTGAILVWGNFVKDDHTVDRFAVFHIGKGESKPLPVYAEGVESFQHGAFDAAGRFYFSAGADLWGGDLAATEHEQAGEFSWQLRAFRFAALGTPVAGEAPNAGRLIDTLATGGGKIIAALGSDDGGALVRFTAPAFTRQNEGGLNRLTGLSERWALQQKVIASAQMLTAANALPRNPIVAVSADGTRIVYQTAGEGVRRWWLLEKGPKPRLLAEESD